MSDFTTIDQVDRITAMGDPILRNLQITQSYHELSSAVAWRTGLCANWCTFATWASRQAGHTIRHEDVIRALENTLSASPNAAQSVANVAAAVGQLGVSLGNAEIQRRVWVALDPSSAATRAANAVARGNLKVFAEIGRVFARFVAECLNDTAFDADHLESFCAAFQPGPPPAGQDNLRRAFSRYYRALFETDGKIQAEHMLLANLEIGLHEQTRLQPEIAEALDAALVDPDQFALNLVSALFPVGGAAAFALLAALRQLDGRTPLSLAIEPLLAAARQQVRMLLTRQMMVLGLPGGLELRLGDDLREQFPPLFQSIASPELRAFLADHEATPDSVRGSGAVDWANLSERMQFITDLFRCYGLAAGLLQPPFTPAQLAAIQASRLPAGSL